MRLAVTSGRVAFRDHGRESFVPAGGWCPLSAEGVGVPRRVHAGDELLALLEAYDRPDCAPGTLDRLLDAARASDALTLWHLLPRVEGEERERLARRVAGSGIPIEEDALTNPFRMLAAAAAPSVCLVPAALAGGVHV